MINCKNKITMWIGLYRINTIVIFDTCNLELNVSQIVYDKIALLRHL
jgi:hypothetical protein